MLAASDAAQLLARVVTRTLTPREPLYVDEWADRYRVLASDTTNESGPWVTDRVPYVRGPMRAYNSPDIDEISLMWAAQTAKTETLLNCLFWTINEDPSPIMWFWPNQELAEKFNVNRVQPAVEASPRLRELRGERPRDQKTTHTKFRKAGCDVFWRGAGSDAQAKSNPAKYRIADEIDAESFDPNILYHARQRAAAWPGGKFIKTSTPSFEGVGIDGEVQRSSCHWYHVPCPHCGLYQRLVFPNLRWEGGARISNATQAERTAHYVCTGCGGIILDHHKPEMLARGVWVCGDQASVIRTDGGTGMPPLAPGHVKGITLPAGYEIVGEPPEKSRHWGYRISGLYSPWVKFGKIAEAWCLHNGEPGRVWLNEVLGEAWSPRGDRVDAGEIIKQCLAVDTRTAEAERATRLSGAYRLGELPTGVLVITGGIDLQRDRAYFVIRGWGELLKQSWLLAFGSVVAPHGDEQATFTMLDEVVKRTIGTTAAKSLGVSRWAIDSGDGVRTGEVYRFSRRHPGRVYACKGRSGDAGSSASMAMPSRKAKIDKYPDGKPIPGGLTLFHVNTWRYKSQLLGVMRQTPPAIVGQDSGPVSNETRWWWPDPYVDAAGADINERLVGYFNMLASEHLVITNERAVNQQGARPQFAWRLRPGRSENHYLDAEVYAWAVAESDFPGITRAYMQSLIARHTKAEQPTPPARKGGVVNEIQSEYRERYGGGE